MGELDDPDIPGKSQVSSRLIGVFGGTFDPPHIGHVVLATEAFYQLKLEKVLWVLTPHPPHKPKQALRPVEERLAMLKIAIRGKPEFQLSRVDIDRPPPHYAIDTMRILAHEYPDAGLVYLVGGDSLDDLPTWHKPQQFIQTCHAIGVMRRPGDSVDMMNLESIIPGISDKVHIFDTPRLEISSSDIRSRIAAGRPFSEYLHPKIYEYIQKKCLYGYN